MNTVVAQLTLRTLLGRRRAAILILLPVVLVGLAVLFRAVAGQDETAAVNLLGGLGLGTIVPLLCVIVGTGSIGPEIEDGSIIYLLSKPVRRSAIVLSKFAVAVVTGWVFLLPAELISGLVLAESSTHLALAYTVTAAVAVVAYCALFLLLAIMSRNAVIIGLLYAIVWETTVAGFVPGARALSIRQWSLVIAERIVGSDARRLRVTSAVDLAPGLVLLAVVTVAAVWYAGQRLRTLRLTTDE